MSQARGGRSAVGRGRTIGGRTSGVRTIGGALAVAAASAAAIGLLAGCGGSSGSTVAGPTTSATTSAVTGATASSGASTGAAFVAITEPFDPGHPAAAKSAPATCGGQNTTLAIEQCYEAKTENADAAIDAMRQASFAGASAAQQAAINGDDRGWLAARATVCAKAYQTGGTIDGINVGGCLLDESTARLDALKGITPPEAQLKSTDSTSLSQLSWYTTPEGSRIAMIDTQGDATGGVIIAWVVIAGADGFAVNPAQFSYRDGSFTDAGKVQGAGVDGHRVAAGTEYQFNVDYSTLSADPHAGKAGGWVYAPGTPAAVWR
jgi:uncharacterized protein YecT (DUF1311 family)